MTVTVNRLLKKESTGSCSCNAIAKFSNVRSVINSNTDGKTYVVINYLGEAIMTDTFFLDENDVLYVDE